MVFCDPRALFGWTVVFLVAVVAPSKGAGPPDTANSADVSAVEFNLFQLPSARLAIGSLQSEARFFWENRPLGDGLQELSQRHRLTIWLDRRIDPTQAVTLETDTEQATLLTGLQGIAEQIEAEIGLVENVAYLCPRGKLQPAQRAAVVLHDTISRQAASSDAQLRDLEWPELATPTSLLKQLESNWQIQIDATLPHDLFHAGRLHQPSALATQLTLLLAPFDKEARCIAPREFVAQPLRDGGIWQANYRASDLHMGRAAELRRQLGGSLRVNGGIATVTGVTELHLGLLTQIRQRKVSPVDLDKRRWAFEVRNSALEAVLNKLADAIGFQLQWAPEISDAERQQLISFQVTDVSLDRLLAEVASVSALVITRQGNSVIVARPSSTER